MNSTMTPASESTASADAGYLRGFQTLDRETTIDRLPVTGTMPAWLGGSLYRNGPAKFEVGRERYAHWFDGQAMLHRFTISNGDVAYGNRYLDSAGYREGASAGRIRRSEFGTLAKVGLVERLRRIGRDTSSQNANVNIVPCGDELLALTETPVPLAFDALSLETRGPRPATGGPELQTITAHPHHIAASRRSINFGITFGRKSMYHVVAVDDGTLARRTIGSIAVDRPAYFHTFALTQRYAVIVEFPLVVNPLDLLIERRPFIDNYHWEPQRGTRFHAMRLDDGRVEHVWEGAPFFAFHHINAFDEGDAIVLDISAYDDATIVDDLRLARLRSPGARALDASFRRYRLVPGRTTAEFETISEVATELPRVAASRHARSYEFAYGVGSSADRPNAVATTIVKVATADRGVRSWSEPGAYPGEPVFVARPGGTAEDDGVVLSVVLDAVRGASALVVLDAADLTELARADVPHHIPFGFHGLFVRA